MSRRHEFRDARDDKLRRLRDELWRARRFILSLMAPELTELLQSYYRCQTLEERDAWESDTVEKLIDEAEILPGPKTAYFPEERAQCPLCKSGSISPYTEGFAVPEGLRRHLVGWGNATQCEVMQAAAALARDHFREKFQAIQDARETEKRATRQAREATETLYRTGPACPGRLRDDVCLQKPRDDAQLAWAENRLTELGFDIEVEGRIRAYTKQGDNWLVFADPRGAGAIRFQLYRPSKRKTKKGTPAWERTRHEFTIQDQWKNDLIGKFASRLAESLEASRVG